MSTQKEHLKPTSIHPSSGHRYGLLEQKTDGWKLWRRSLYSLWLIMTSVCKKELALGLSALQRALAAADNQYTRGDSCIDRFLFRASPYLAHIPKCVHVCWLLGECRGDECVFVLVVYPTNLSRLCICGTHTMKIPYVHKWYLFFLLSSATFHLNNGGFSLNKDISVWHQQPHSISLITGNLTAFPKAATTDKSFKILQFILQVTDWLIRDGICSGWAPSVMCICVCECAARRWMAASEALMAHVLSCWVVCCAVEQTHT